MGKFVGDLLGLLMALIMVAAVHDDPSKEKAVVLADAKACLVDLPDGPIKTFLAKVPQGTTDFLLSVAASVAVNALNKSPLFPTGESGS